MPVQDGPPGHQGEVPAALDQGQLVAGKDHRPTVDAINGLATGEAGIGQAQFVG